jgi:hypothetical protein
MPVALARDGDELDYGICFVGLPDRHVVPVAKLAEDSEGCGQDLSRRGRTNLTSSLLESEPRITSICGFPGW